MSLTTIKHIDNAHHEYKLSILGPRSEMPQLLKCLSDNIYSFNYKLVSDTEFVSDVFWSHSNFIKLFNIFPIVLVMESTYKSNKYKLPLFELIDVTSTDMRYSIAIAFMTSENEDNIIWTLQHSNGLDWPRNASWEYNYKHDRVCSCLIEKVSC
jgi:alpha-glucosidase